MIDRNFDLDLSKNLDHQIAPGDARAATFYYLEKAFSTNGSERARCMLGAFYALSIAIGIDDLTQAIHDSSELLLSPTNDS